MARAALRCLGVAARADERSADARRKEGALLRLLYQEEVLDFRRKSQDVPDILGCLEDISDFRRKSADSEDIETKKPDPSGQGAVGSGRPAARPGPGGPLAVATSCGPPS